MCSEKEETCIDAALVCNGLNECPGGEDENPGGMDCEEYECPYPEYGVFKCNHTWATWDTKLCAHMGWVCDGYADCAGSEDEPDDCYDDIKKVGGAEISHRQLQQQRAAITSALSTPTQDHQDHGCTDEPVWAEWKKK